MGTFLIDLSRPPGRAYFSKTINAVLDQFSPGAVHYDGFEKLQLIAGQDFAHSSKTFDSGMWRGLPTPDWYHGVEGWPLRWGLGILQGIEEAHRNMNPHTAVEGSFMSPGLGPWRFDMAPYVDEHGPDLVALGLEWHPKMLLRIEITGTIVNAYRTYTEWFPTFGPAPAYPLEYFLGGLITGGLAFQPSGSIPSAAAYDDQIHDWMTRYKRYGHATEDGVRTLYYDEGCCHIQGVCEWTACQDAVVSRLVGGTTPNVTGLLLGSPKEVTVPPAYLGHNGTLLVFLAHGVTSSTVHFGSPTDQRVQLVPTAATNSSAARTLGLGGGFWELRAQDIRMSTIHEDGRVLHSQLLFGKPVTGARSYTMSLDHSARAGSLLTLFEKVPPGPN